MLARRLISGSLLYTRAMDKRTDVRERLHDFNLVDRHETLP